MRSGVGPGGGYSSQDLVVRGNGLGGRGNRVWVELGFGGWMGADVREKSIIVNKKH